jgi:hypothetical protein
MRWLCLLVLCVVSQTTVSASDPAIAAGQAATEIVSNEDGDSAGEAEHAPSEAAGEAEGLGEAGEADTHPPGPEDHSDMGEAAGEDPPDKPSVRADCAIAGSGIKTESSDGSSDKNLWIKSADAGGVGAGTQLYLKQGEHEAGPFTVKEIQSQGTNSEGDPLVYIHVDPSNDFGDHFTLGSFLFVVECDAPITTSTAPPTTDLWKEDVVSDLGNEDEEEDQSGEADEEGPGEAGNTPQADDLPITTSTSTAPPTTDLWKDDVVSDLGNEDEEEDQSGEADEEGPGEAGNTPPAEENTTATDPPAATVTDAPPLVASLSFMGMTKQDFDNDTVVKALENTLVSVLGATSVEVQGYEDIGVRRRNAAGVRVNFKATGAAAADMSDRLKDSVESGDLLAELKSQNDAFEGATVAYSPPEGLGSSSGSQTSDDDDDDGLGSGGIAGVVIGSFFGLCLVAYLATSLSARSKADELNVETFPSNGNVENGSWMAPEPHIEVVRLANLGTPGRRRTQDYRIVESPNSLMKGSDGAAPLSPLTIPVDESEHTDPLLPGSPN